MFKRKRRQKNLSHPSYDVQSNISNEKQDSDLHTSIDSGDKMHRHEEREREKKHTKDSIVKSVLTLEHSRSVSLYIYIERDDVCVYIENYSLLENLRRVLFFSSSSFFSLSPFYLLSIPLFIEQKILLEVIKFISFVFFSR